jgi:hypothetical protein
LHTIMQTGDDEESTTSQQMLSNSWFCDHISMDTDEFESHTAHLAQCLQKLQHSNFHLTSGPLPCAPSILELMEIDPLPGECGFPHTEIQPLLVKFWQEKHATNGGDDIPRSEKSEDISTGN